MLEEIKDDANKTCRSGNWTSNFLWRVAGRTPHLSLSLIRKAATPVADDNENLREVAGGRRVGSLGLRATHAHKLKNKCASKCNSTSRNCKPGVSKGRGGKWRVGGGKHEHQLAAVELLRMQNRTWQEGSELVYKKTMPSVITKLSTVNSFPASSPSPLSLLLSARNPALRPVNLIWKMRLKWKTDTKNVNLQTEKLLIKRRQRKLSAHMWTLCVCVRGEHK